MEITELPLHKEEKTIIAKFAQFREDIDDEEGISVNQTMHIELPNGEFDAHDLY